jgi:Fe-S cluster assembly ATP-binding protein
MALIIKNLHVSIKDQPILTGLSLTINPGEIHVIMGPNGSGKSTLANTLMGHPNYTVTKGTIVLDGTDITHLSPDKRARLGLFLSMQHPPELAGVSMSQFLRLAKNTLSNTTVNPLDFNKNLNATLGKLGLDQTFAQRPVNAGFSGGEKKRAEIAQALLLNPTYAILDEIDSGLDVDGLRMTADGINQFKNPNNSLLLITHYNRILEYIVPNHVHIMVKGTIVKSGDKKLAEEIEKNGYEGIR